MQFNELKQIECMICKANDKRMGTCNVLRKINNYTASIHLLFLMHN